MRPVVSSFLSTIAASSAILAASLTSGRVAAFAAVSATVPTVAQPQSTLAELESSHTRNPDDRRVALRLARAYLSVGDQGAAVAVLVDIVGRDPADSDARVALGQAYALEADYANAEQQYRAALQVRPDDATAEAGLGQTLLLEGKYREACRVFARTVARDRSNIDARLGLATAETDEGRYSAARADYEAVRVQRPGDTSALVGLARADYLSGDLLQANQLDGRVLDASPNDTDALELRRILGEQLAPVVDTEYTSTSAGPTFRAQEASFARWYPSPRFQLGALYSTADLRASTGSTSATRAGLSASYVASASNGVDLQLLDSHFTGHDSTLDSRLEAHGAADGLSYRAGVFTGGVDGVADASDDIIYPAAAAIRVTTIFARAKLQRDQLSGDLAARMGYYNDDNHYREIVARLARRFDYPTNSALTVSVSARVAAFSDNYSLLASHGYLDYLHQNDIVLSAAAQHVFRAGTIGLLASSGWRDTIVTTGNSGALPFVVVSPFIRTTSGATTIAADANFGRYSGGPRVAGYAIETLRVNVAVRL